MIYIRTEPGKQTKISALVSVYVSETVITNSFPVMIPGQTPESKKKKQSLVSVYVSETVNTNSFPLMIYTRQTPESKKKAVPTQKFLFTLMHDLSAPPTLRFFRFAQKTPLARNYTQNLLEKEYINVYVGLLVCIFRSNVKLQGKFKFPKSIYETSLL